MPQVPVLHASSPCKFSMPQVPSCNGSFWRINHRFINLVFNCTKGWYFIRANLCNSWAYLHTFHNVRVSSFSPFQRICKGYIDVLKYVYLGTYNGNAFRRHDWLIESKVIKSLRQMQFYAGQSYFFDESVIIRMIAVIVDKTIFLLCL